MGKVEESKTDSSCTRQVAWWHWHRRLYDWVVHFADTKHGLTALFILSFAESSFFPVPPDVLLAPLTLGAPKKWFRFALSCSLASVIGGIVGYFIGSPGMNFIPCRMQDGIAYIGDRQIPVGNGSEKLSGNFELGIRPEFLKLHTHEVQGSHPVAIKAVEDLGNCKIVTLQFAGHPLKVKLTEDQSIPDESGFLEFQPQWIRLYADGNLIEHYLKKQSNSEH